MQKGPLILLLSIASVLLQAQSLSFMHINTSGGLLSDVNLRMAEDALGRLWIAGAEGINLFDGYEVVSFSVPGNSGLNSNAVQQIYADAGGTIWIATDKGVQRVLSPSNKFEEVYAATGRPLPDGRFFIEEEGLLYLVCTTTGYVLSEGVWQPAPGIDKLIATYGQPQALERVNNGWWLWAVRDEVVLAQLLTGGTQRRFAYGRVSAICAATDSSFLLSSFVRDSTFLLNVYTGRVEHIQHWRNAAGQKLGGYIASMQRAAPGMIAMAGRFSGLTLLNLASGTFVRYLHEPGNAKSLNASFTRRLLITRNGTVFVSCNGLSYTALKPLQFLSVSSFTNAQGQRVDGVINGFGSDRQGNVWVATNFHLVKWSRSGGHSAFYPFVDVLAGDGSTREIRTIAEDPNGSIWVGSFVGGLGKLEGGRIRQLAVRVPRLPHQLVGNNITSIVKLSPRQWVINTMEGFCLLDPITERVSTFHDHPHLQQIHHHTTYHLLPDEEGAWWLAQAGYGIWYYHPRQGLLQRVADSLMPAGTDYYNLCTDRQGHIYAASTAGLCIIHRPSRQVVRLLTRQDGLATNLQYGVIADEENNIWAAGNRGLARYSPKTQMVKSFDVYDGVLQSNHKVNSIYKTETGEIFVGGEDGFNHFYPLAIKATENKFSIQISHAEVQDEVWNPAEKNELSFPHFKNQANFHFLTTDFMLAPYMQYRYRLVGIDTNWIPAGKIRQARYTHLKPGHYRFEVQASLDGKAWLQAPAAATFSIQKPWWDNGCIHAAALLVLAAAVYLSFWLRLKKVRTRDATKAAFEQKISKVQMNLLRAQMNPHFIYNSLNSINSFILKNDPRNASGYLTKFSRLMRLILDNSRNDWVSLESELKLIELYMELEALRCNHHFTFGIAVHPTLMQDAIVLPPMLLQPYIENAIWHGLAHRTAPGGHIQVEVMALQQQLQIVISDNGIGRKAAHEKTAHSPKTHKSYGLKITDERIQLVNTIYNIDAVVHIEDRYDTHGLSAGTEVTISMKKIMTAS